MARAIPPVTIIARACPPILRRAYTCGKGSPGRAACPILAVAFRGEFSRLPETLYPVRLVGHRAYSNTIRVRCPPGSGGYDFLTPQDARHPPLSSRRWNRSAHGYLTRLRASCDPTLPLLDSSRRPT